MAEQGVYVIYIDMFGGSSTGFDLCRSSRSGTRQAVTTFDREKCLHHSMLNKIGYLSMSLAPTPFSH